MKNYSNFLRFALLAVVLISGIHASAYDFYSGGIYYGISSTGVTVENKGSFNTYSGNVTIPETVTYGGKTYNVIGIGYQAFKNCTGLTNVTIPKTVYLLLNESFYGCNSLTTIILPSSITSIYNNAFVGCTGLQSIYVRRTTPASANTNNFSASTYTSATLYVPEEAYDAYKATAPWSSFTNIKKTNYDFEKNGIYYKITDASAKTVAVTYRDTDYDNYSGSVSIPSSVSYDGTTYSVTAIGQLAFRGSNDGGHLTSVTIPSSVKTIDNYAFWLQKNLGNVSIPSSVTSIGKYAFCWCSNMTRISIPNSVTSIGRDAFAQCKNASSLTIGSGIKTIEQDCFYDCVKLTTVTIPNNVTSIVTRAFTNCSSMTSITIGSGVTSMGSEVFNGCSALSSVKSMAITPPSITSNTFDASHYSSVTLTVPYSSKSAYQAANYWKNFTTITTQNYDFLVDGLYYRKTSSNTVEITYKDTNYNSYSGGIIIPKTITVGGTTYTVTAVGDNAFRSCANLSDVTLNANIKTIGTSAFWNCPKLTSIYSMPSGLTSIGDYAFNMCSALKSITIPNNVTSIGAAAFSGCTTIQTIVIPNKVTSIGSNTFMGCTALKSLTIGTGLTEISYQMCDGCSALTNVVIPNSITKIKTFAFRSCTSLTEVTLGSGLTSLDTSPFKGCTALTKVTSLASTPPTMDNSGCFETSTYSSATLNVPGASLNAYKSADWWRMFSTINSLPFDFYVNGIYYKKTSSSTVEVTYKELMAESYSGNITIPSTIKVGNVTYKVTAIGIYAFYLCTNLTRVTMPTSVTKIDGCAFEGCSGLTSVGIPTSVTYLGVDAFARCTGLKSIAIPNSVTEIDQLAFSGCTAMTSASIGSGVTKIRQKAFDGCTALTSITCLAITPPTMIDKNCFGTSTYNTATLTVPKRSLSAYKSADWWRMFSTIVGGDFGGDPGDVNGDGELNIADVNAVIDAILSDNKDAKFDVNGDNEVNIADVNTLIDLILNK